jgi:predicted Fe-Mo cluster-binding NifX family protein
MKIAVATMDGSSVSQHFGQSRGFIVFEMDGQQIKSRELRSGNSTPHNDGVCQSEPHNHDGMAGMLAGCEVMICGGMGAGAANAVQQMGVRAVIVPGVPSAEQAVALFVEGKIDSAAVSLCNCHH